MRVLELAFSGEVVNDGDFSGGFGRRGFGPDSGSLGTGGGFLLNLGLRRGRRRCGCSSSGTRSDDRHFFFFFDAECGWGEEEGRVRKVAAGEWGRSIEEES